jgi:FKBP-type peptidyl-prolyl cis-trans isomerase 2/predicted Fe-Mo cluster-binding NifX family protein
MLIAIPSDDPGGLEAPISEHFGHCAAFTIVAVDNGEIGDVSIVANGGHDEGGCMAPVQMLKHHGVDVLVAGGMGQRPLMGFQQVGIEVHFKETAGSVGEAVRLYLDGGCRAFGEAQTCGGGGGGCGGHHHVEREPIDGTADVRDGRVVTLDFELEDADGTALDSSTRTGPMRYLHGAGQLLPGLESAVTGLEEGATATVELACADAFGEHDDARVFEHPRDKLPSDVKVGDLLAGQDQHGHQVPLRVIHLDDTAGRLDGNHPLAGRDIVFKVRVAKVENATAEELAQQRAF